MFSIAHAYKTYCENGQTMAGAKRYDCSVRVAGLKIIE